MSIFRLFFVLDRVKVFVCQSCKSVNVKKYILLQCIHTKTADMFSLCGTACNCQFVKTLHKYLVIKLKYYSFAITLNYELLSSHRSERAQDFLSIMFNDAYDDIIKTIQRQ